MLVVFAARTRGWILFALCCRILRSFSAELHGVLPSWLQDFSLPFIELDEIAVEAPGVFLQPAGVLLMAAQPCCVSALPSAV